MVSRGRHLNEIIFHYEPKGLYFQIKKKFEIFQKKSYLRIKIVIHNAWVRIPDQALKRNLKNISWPISSKQISG